jgi:integrase
MPKVVKRLTDKEIENVKAAEKDYKLYDGDGLQLLVRKSGTKVWQYPYSFNGKRNIYTIGKYLRKGVAGHISIFDARKVRYDVSNLLDNGLNPNEHKQGRSSALQADDITFEAVAREWHGKGTWVHKHAQNIIRSLERDVFSYIGLKPISEVNAQDIVKLLTIIESRGAYDVAKRTCQRCEAVFDYAITKGLCDLNPAIGRAKFIKKRKTKNRPHLKENQLPDFLNKLDHYHGRNYIRYAAHLLVLTFLRPGELRCGLWQEIDFQKEEWRIPAERMKMDRDHVVPLSRQALGILKKLHAITGHSDFLFPSVITPHKPISDVTLIKVLRVMGYKSGELVPHGFRHTASTILNEHRHAYDVIERQLAHIDKNKVRGTYNHAEYLDERKRMMQWYSDHLDKLRAQGQSEDAKRQSTNLRSSICTPTAIIQNKH